MKGITPVIAVILLLLITIAITGFAFVWFGRIASTAANITESELAALRDTTAKKVAIDNVDTQRLNVTIRNIGSLTLSTNDIQVYVNNAIKTCKWDVATVPANIAPGTTITCHYGVSGDGCNVLPAPVTCTNKCISGTSVRAASPGNSDEVIC